VQSALRAALRPLLALSFALLALGAFAVHAQDQRSPAAAARDHDGRGALAVLRRDGVLFPFASFSRDSWRVTWPVNLAPYLDIPATQEAIPKAWWGTRVPGQWRAHLTTGDAVSLEVKAPEVFQSFCGPRLGLRTTYRSREPVPPVRVDPFPKDGLAISGGVPLEPIESVSATSPEWPAMAASLVGHFNRVEDETLKRVDQRTEWRHPIPLEVRRALPVRLESWYRSPSGEHGWTISYVELVRQYPPGPDDKGCGLETLVSGWLHHRDGKLMEGTELRGKVTYCDRVGATYMLPFGRIRPKDQTYWVFQLSGWESEWYEVVSVRPTKIRYVLEVLAGHTGRCTMPLGTPRDRVLR
jgi:hypothetical protein